MGLSDTFTYTGADDGKVNDRSLSKTDNKFLPRWKPRSELPVDQGYMRCVMCDLHAAWMEANKRGWWDKPETCAGKFYAKPCTLVRGNLIISAVLDPR